MVANLTVRSLEYTSDLQSHIEIVCHLLLEKKPKPPATVCGKPSRWCGQSVQILLNYVGCEARKLPAGGEVFFLDFSFYRANRTCGQDRRCEATSLQLSSLALLPLPIAFLQPARSSPFLQQTSPASWPQ